MNKSHIPGVKNTTTDLMSRLCYHNKEWYLSQRAVKSHFDQFEKPEIDLFPKGFATQNPGKISN